MTDDELRQRAIELQNIINNWPGRQFPVNATVVFAELLRRWADAKSAAAEAEAARFGAVECANRLREQLAEAIEPHNRTIDESQEALAHSRDDLAEALVDATRLNDGPVRLSIGFDGDMRVSWGLRSQRDDRIIIGDRNAEWGQAAAAIRAAIAPKPPTKQEVAEALAGIKASYNKGVDDPRMDGWFRRLYEFVAATTAAMGKEGEV